MKKAIVLAAVVLAIAWCGAGRAALRPEIKEAQALAAGTYPLEYQSYSASSGYALLIESVAVQPGDTVTVGLYIRNDDPIRAFNLPLIIRSIDRGSYMTAMSAAFNPNSRLNGYLNGEYGDTVYITPIINTYPHYGLTSDGPRRNIWGLLNPPAPPDFISPDGLLFARFRILPENDLPPGSDGVPGNGTPMMTVRFRVNETPGRFEIDTSFTEPSHHPGFIPSAPPVRLVTPEFTKGVVTIEGEREFSDPQDTVAVDDPPGADIGDTLVIELPEDTVVAGDSNVVVIDPPPDSLPGLDTTYIATQPPQGPNYSQSDAAQPRNTSAETVRYELVSNYPNPFNSSTTIHYTLDGSRKVTVVVYDLLGRTVTTLVDAYQPPGDYNIPWEGRDAYGRTVPAGIYFYRVQKGDFRTVGKMVLLK